MKKTLQELGDDAAQSRYVRAFSRFSQNRGPLLAAGIAYMGLFSLTAAITVGWTAFSRVLGRNSTFKQSVIGVINEWIPGLLQSSADPSGLVDPDTLVSMPGTSITGWAALALAVVTASTVIWYLGLALRSMFGLAEVTEPIVRTVFGRVVGLFALIFSIALTGVLTLISTFLRDLVRRTFGAGLATGIDIAAVLLPMIMDGLVFITMVRLVARVRPPKKDLVQGALLCAIASTVLRLSGTEIVGSVRGPILTAATSVVTIMLWLNLIGWITLYFAAWTANPPPPGTPRLATREHEDERPNYVTLSDPRTLAWVSGHAGLGTLTVLPSKNGRVPSQEKPKNGQGSEEPPSENAS